MATERDEYEAGRTLYHRWCGSSTTDRARYYDLMNPADKRAWQRLAAEVASPADPDAAHVSGYTFFPNDDPGQFDHDAVRVERTNWGSGPHPDAPQWAVRWLSYCLNRNGNWVYEPIPSSRDRAFLASCRFSKDDALARARRLIADGVAS